MIKGITSAMNRLSRKLYITACLPVLLVGLTLAPYLLYLSVNDARTYHLKESDYYLVMLSDAAEYALVTGDITLLKNIAGKILAQNKRVLGIKVLDRRHKTVLSLGDMEAFSSADAYMVEQNVYVKKILFNDFDLDSEAIDEHTQSENPLTARDDTEAIGKIKLFADKRYVKQTITHRLVRSGLLIVVSFLAGMFLLRKKVLKTIQPIHDIQSAISKLARKEFDFSIAATRQDEFGDIETAINDLAAVLREYEAQLKNKIAQSDNDRIGLVNARDEMDRVKQSHLSFLKRMHQNLDQSIQDALNLMSNVDRHGVDELNRRCIDLSVLHLEKISELYKQFFEQAVSDFSVVTLKKEPFCFREKIFDLVNYFRTLIKDKNLELCLNIEYDSKYDNPLIYNDPVRFSQIIRNLLSHSIRIENNQRLSIRVFWQDDALHQNLYLCVELVNSASDLNSLEIEEVNEMFRENVIAYIHGYHHIDEALLISKGLANRMGANIHVRGNDARMIYTIEMDAPVFAGDRQTGLAAPVSDVRSLQSKIVIAYIGQNDAVFRCLSEYCLKHNMPFSSCDQPERLIKPADGLQIVFTHAFLNIQNVMQIGIIGDDLEQVLELNNFNHILSMPIDPKDVHNVIVSCQKYHTTIQKIFS